MRLYGCFSLSLIVTCVLSLAACGQKEPRDLPSSRLQLGDDYRVLDKTTIECASAEHSRINGYNVAIDFRPTAAKWFQDMTASNVGKPFDFILNNKVIVSPNINKPILGNSISLPGRTENDTSEIKKWLKTLDEMPKCSHT